MAVAEIVRLFLHIAFILSTFWMWLLILRAAVAWFGLDPYHPAVVTLMKLTEPLVQPFRFGPFLKPARIDPAVWPAIAILFIVSSATALALFT